MSLTIRISEEDKKLLEEYAKAHDLSMSQVVRKALKKFFEELKEE